MSFSLYFTDDLKQQMLSELTNRKRDILTYTRRIETSPLNCWYLLYVWTKLYDIDYSVFGVSLEVDDVSFISSPIVQLRGPDMASYVHFKTSVLYEQWDSWVTNVKHNKGLFTPLPNGTFNLSVVKCSNLSIGTGAILHLDELNTDVIDDKILVTKNAVDICKWICSNCKGKVYKLGGTLFFEDNSDAVKFKLVQF